MELHSWNDFARCVSMLDPWQHGYARATQVINYLESHDEQRAAWELNQAGFDHDQAQRKAMLGAAILFTMPGLPMLYQGQEWGEATERNANARNTLHWEAKAGQGQPLWQRYRQLAQLRREHIALRSEGFALDLVSAEQQVLVYHRWHAAGNEVVVAANFSPTPQRLAIPLPRPGTWQVMLGGQRHTVEGAWPMELDASSAEIFVKVHEAT